jgi:hypothetical protein
MTDYQEAAEHNLSDEAHSASLPSATETFRDLVVDMKKAGTETLFIDLRYNQGGHIIMADILLYFLYGKDTLMASRFRAQAAGGGWVERYSQRYFETITNITLQDINQGRAVPLVVGDYDFKWDYTDDPGRFQLSEIAASQERWFERSPTFYAEYASGTYGAYYRPQNVVVLIDTDTFSSGFAMARYLYNAGAILVGTPSSQAPNCFGRNQLDWELDHTHIQGTISIGYSVRYPEDPEIGRVLPVHYPLTYEKLAFYDFDSNAEVLYALELLPELGQAPHAPVATTVEQEPSAPPTEATPEPTLRAEPTRLSSSQAQDEAANASTRLRYYSQEELIEDARQIADIIESAHPDPYIRGGGKIAFHRRLHRLLNAIPKEGMTRDEFVRLLRPFIAAVGDAHTYLWDDYSVNNYAPGGVPLRFDIVEQSLYVAGVPNGMDRDLIGARLVSVEGVPLAELVERQKRLQGSENEYNTLLWLSMFSLWYRPFMEDLLPEWQDTSQVAR